MYFTCLDNRIWCLKLFRFARRALPLGTLTENGPYTLREKTAICEEISDKLSDRIEKDDGIYHFMITNLTKSLLTDSLRHIKKPLDNKYS